MPIGLFLSASLILTTPAEGAEVFSKSAVLKPGGLLSVSVPAASEAERLLVLVSLTDPRRATPGVPVVSRLKFAEHSLAKTLHLGDPDVVHPILRPPGAPLTVELQADARQSRELNVSVRVSKLTESPDGVAFEAEPNDSAESANPLTLGRTLFGFADDRAYLPLGDEPTEAERSGGVDWYRFEFAGETPKLAFFGIEYIDRDVPPDVRIFRLQDGKPVEYVVGIDPQSSQRERPPRLGANKFTTRTLTKGTYFIQVDACQPDYQLRTKLYDVPPYLKPDDVSNAAAVAKAADRAIRVAMDFQLLAGDSWHANTPRKGHAMDRVANVHHEVSTCVACHPTHFTTQSVMAAVKNGYRVEEPYALKFLTERLYNNPVPLHGHPDAVWARMISAGANVLSRISTMTMDFEESFGVPRRDNTHRAIAEFLRLYYDGRDKLPEDETNGNNPVSRYKVASDSRRQLDNMYRRTGDDRYRITRDVIDKVLPTEKPAHTRALAAQTIGLCQADVKRFSAKIEENVKRILELQRDDGQWAVQLDRNAAASQMQTGECLVALSLAGLPADHPAIRKGVAALLTIQKDFGGWFDLNPYEQFRTPFRETQWALMAISQIHKGPGSRGWNGPLGPQARSIRTDSLARTVLDLESIWDAPSPETLKRIAELTAHESPLARLSACSALARVGDLSSVRPLVVALGDESKVVRRAAAEAIRLIGNRLHASRPAGSTEDQRDFVKQLEIALGESGSVARGATRVFASHFRELSAEHRLADALLRRVLDEDPVVAMQAIKGLWRFWYWQADDSFKSRIEDRLIAALAEPAHPWTRRNLIEALYIIGDDNIRYLYKNWVPMLADEDSQIRVNDAQHATVNRLGEKYAVALGKGNALQREGILRALSEFHERPGGAGRVGNDTEQILFYEETLNRVSAALVKQAGDADPTIRRLALQAMITVRGNRDASLARTAAARQADTDPGVRDWAATMSREFPLEVKKGQAEPELLALVDDLLAKPLPYAQATALSLIARLGPADRPEFDRLSAIRGRLDSPIPSVRAAAFRALDAFPKPRAEESIKAATRKALADPDPDARVSALRLVLDRKIAVSEKPLREALEDATPSHRVALLGAVAANKPYASDLRLIGVVSGSLTDENGGVREKALQVIQTHPSLVNNPAVEDGLRELSRSDNARQKEIARSLLASRGRSSAAGASDDLLDLAYFEAKVLPIFNAMGEDGQNCVGCHRSHTILKMLPPGKDGRWTAQDLRANFRSTLRVVNLADPSDSLLLKKPTWDAAEEAEAQNDPTKKAHSGGVRFEPKTSQEYQTILDWINGARLKPKDAQAAR